MLLEHRVSALQFVCLMNVIGAQVSHLRRYAHV